MARKAITMQMEVPRPPSKLAAVDFEVQTLFNEKVMAAATNFDVEDPAWIGREKLSLFLSSSANVVVSIWLGATKTDFYLWKTLDSTDDFETVGGVYYYVAELPLCVGMRITVSNTTTVTAKIIAS